MVEKLLNDKGSQELVKLATEMNTFQNKLTAYTQSNCTYTREMDKCILELLYYTNQTRTLMSETRNCFEDCDSTDVNCKMICVKDARTKYTEMQDMTEQMVEFSKSELKRGADKLI